MRNELLDADKKKEPVKPVQLRTSQNSNEEKAKVKTKVKSNKRLKASRQSDMFQETLHMLDFKNRRFL